MTRLEKKVERAIFELYDAMTLTYGKAESIRKAVAILQPLIEIAAEQEKNMEEK